MWDLLAALLKIHFNCTIRGNTLKNKQIRPSKNKRGKIGKNEKYMRRKRLAILIRLMERIILCFFQR
jgi:hypothetical protein